MLFGAIFFAGCGKFSLPAPAQIGAPPRLGGFGVAVRFTICLMFGGEPSFEPLAGLGFLWRSGQIVPRRQPLPDITSERGAIERAIGSNRPTRR
jgi:hypothetical protein